MTPYGPTASIVALVLAGATPVAAAPALADEVGGYASTHLVIRTRSGVTAAPGSEGRTAATSALPALRAADGAATTRSGRVFNARLRAWEVSAIRPVFEGFAHPRRAR